MSTFCCYQPESNNAYDKSDADTTKPLLPQAIKRDTPVNQYPATSRSINPDLPPKNTTFVKTGGNALQAVDSSVLDQKNLVQVVVPDNNMGPGDTVHVLAPDGSGRLIAARIPEGHGAGSVFFVTMPFPAVAVVTGVPIDRDLVVVNSMDVTAQPAEQDLELAEENGSTNNTESIRVLVRVPEDSKPGDSIRVELPDKRVVEAVVPHGNVQDFYVEAPCARDYQHSGASARPMMSLPAFD